MKHFYTASEVKELLGLGHIRTAQMRVKAMNDDLLAKGFWVERGKVPISYFHEKYPYIERKENADAKRA